MTRTRIECISCKCGCRVEPQTTQERSQVALEELGHVIHLRSSDAMVGVLWSLATQQLAHDLGYCAPACAEAAGAIPSPPWRTEVNPDADRLSDWDFLGLITKKVLGFLYDNTKGDEFIDRWRIFGLRVPQSLLNDGLVEKSPSSDSFRLTIAGMELVKRSRQEHRS